MGAKNRNHLAAAATPALIIQCDGPHDGPKPTLKVPYPSECAHDDIASIADAQGWKAVTFSQYHTHAYCPDCVRALSQVGARLAAGKRAAE